MIIDFAIAEAVVDFCCQGGHGMDDDRRNDTHADPILHLLDARELAAIVFEEAHCSASAAERAASRILGRLFEFLQGEDERRIS
jgi:hypothetical protein